jgi:hypothetical protein
LPRISLDPEREALRAAADAVPYQDHDLRPGAAVAAPEPRHRIVDPHQRLRGNDRRDREAPDPAGGGQALDAGFMVDELG